MVMVATAEATTAAVAPISRHYRQGACTACGRFRAVYLVRIRPSAVQGRTAGPTPHLEIRVSADRG